MAVVPFRSSNRSIGGVVEETVREAFDFADAAWSADRENREEAMRDLEFLANHQWSADERRTREADNRPVLTVNRLIHPVKQIQADIRQMQPHVMVQPVDGEGDEGIAATFAGLMRQIQRNSKARYVYAAAASHAAACGIGHYRIATRYAGEDTFDQELFLELIPHPLSVLWEPAATEPDRADAQRCLLFEYVPKAQFKRRFPGAQDSDFAPHHMNTETGFRWAREDHVAIAEYWRMVEAKRTIGMTEDGKIIDLTDVKSLDGSLPKILQTREVDSYTVRHSLVSGTDLLEDDTDWPGRHIPIIPVIGNELPLDRTVVRHGVVRFARDSQKMYNYWRSSAAEWVGQSTRAPYLVTTNMIKQFKSWWDTHNTVPRPYLPWDPDPNAPGIAPQRLSPSAPPEGFWREGQMAADEIKATTGMFDASLGARSNEISGRAIDARKQQGEDGNSEYGDNLAISIERTGAVMLDLIPKIYDTTRVLRILDEEERDVFVPINQPVLRNGQPSFIHDLSVGKYDVTISLGMATKTRRDRASQSLIEYAQMNPAVMAVAGDLIAESQDWPGKDKLAARLRRVIELERPGIIEPEGAPKQPSPDEQQQMQMQKTAMHLELREKEADVRRIEATAIAQEAKATKSILETAILKETGYTPGPRPAPQAPRAI